MQKKEKERKKQEVPGQRGRQCFLQYNVLNVPIYYIRHSATNCGTISSCHNAPKQEELHLFYS